MQQLIQGEHTIQQIGQKIIESGYSNVFLITGKHFGEQKEYPFLSGLNVYHWIKQGINVEERESEAAWKAFRLNGDEVIVAIGGGSVMDLAKAILYHCIKSSHPVPYFIAAPTTAGSGSEATHFAVVYKGKKKFSWVNPLLLPSLAVLDPSLTYSLSPYQTAVSGMDALTQAVESYWSKNATDESNRYASAAIHLWKDFFLTAVQKPDATSREKMLEAAYLSGKAINITRTTGPHALSYYLTAHHGISHGHAVAFFLPVFFLYNDPQEELYKLLGVKNSSEAKDFIRQIMQQAGLSTTLKESGIDKASIIDDLLHEVNEERFANNPVPFDREKLKKLILTHL